MHLLKVKGQKKQIGWFPADYVTTLLSQPVLSAATHIAVGFVELYFNLIISHIYHVSSLCWFPADSVASLTTYRVICILF